MTHVVCNVSCEANTQSWKEGRRVVLDTRRGHKLTNIQIWFPAGVAGRLYLRIMKGGAPLLPDNRFVELEPPRQFGDAITAESGGLTFEMNTELKGAEYISVEYRNTDTNDVYEVFVDFQFKHLPTEKSELRS